LSHVKYLQIRAKMLAEQEQRAKQAKADAQKVIAEERKRFAEAQAAAEVKAKAAEETLKKKNEEQREALENANEAMAKLKAEKSVLEKNGKELTEQAVTAARKQIEAEFSKKTAAERANDRQALKADFDKQMLKQSGEWGRERLKLLSKNKELERMLEAKTANALGDAAEIDLLEMLKAEFEDEGDKVARTRKGEEGADILHEVKYKGEICGRILIESKNRQQWRSADITKLRNDMLNAKADHGILAPAKFPADKNEMFNEEGVWVVKAREVVQIARLMRDSLVQMHKLNLSNEERSEKKAKLYEYINSSGFRQKLDQVLTAAQDMLDLEVDERKQHDSWWKTRALAARKTQTVLSGIDTEISAIVDGKSHG